jgi:RNA-directed DNA polymerase
LAGGVKVTEKINNIIKKGKAWTQEAIIIALNPVIIGWSNYHQPVVAKETFNKLDHIIWNMLWHWAKRRHSGKSHRWIVDRYWHKAGNRNWIFSTKDKQLKLLSDTKIVRHIPLKLDKNPYLDTEYFVLRKLKQSVKKLTNSIRNNVNKICKPNTATMTNNCCPI